MPRKGPAQRRELTPDPIYRSLLVAQIVNKVMLHGKRSVAEKIVYDALKIVEEKSGAEPIPPKFPQPSAIRATASPGSSPCISLAASR